MEDYEYLSVLKHYRDLALKKGKLNDSLAAETAAMLKLPDHIVRTTNSWTKSEKELTRFRNQVAEMIVRLQQLVKE